MAKKPYSRRLQAAAFGLYAPSPERRQHDRITVATQQIVDALGGIGMPNMAEGLLGRLERQGDIGPSERAAGDEFQRLFRLAQLDPLRAADMGRLGGPCGTGPNGVEWARRRMNEALQALGGHGSPCGTCAWFVLGVEMSVREWAQREGWNGHAISEHVAKGTLIGALGVLAKHFGL